MAPTGSPCVVVATSLLYGTFDWETDRDFRREALADLESLLARKRPYRHRNTCKRIIKRLRVWRPPRRTDTCL